MLLWLLLLICIFVLFLFYFFASEIHLYFTILFVGQCSDSTAQAVTLARSRIYLLQVSFQNWYTSKNSRTLSEIQQKLEGIVLRRSSDLLKVLFVIKFLKLFILSNKKGVAASTSRVCGVRRAICGINMFAVMRWLKRLLIHRLHVFLSGSFYI